MHIHGGFKTQTVVQIGNILDAYNTGRISLSGLRAYFAALAACASREAALRCGRRSSRPRPRCCYQASEIAQLCRIPLNAARRELRALERAGLLLFSCTEIAFTAQPLPGSHSLIESLAGGRSALRPVPLPRAALRFFSRCSKVATIKTMLAYCVRGLSLTRNGQLTGKGTAKAAWIAETCGLSLRAVRAARAELITAGFITADEGSTQWKLNRHGAYFTINLAGGWSERVTSSRPDSDCEFASPPGEKRTEFAPPYEDKKTPSGSENQKTRCRERSGSWRGAERRPRLSDIQPEDLRSVSRALVLHAEAVRAGLASDSAAGRLAFLAAAIHATRVANRNAPGLFATLVRRGQWQFATQDDEERARRCWQRWEDKRSLTTTMPTATGSSGGELAALRASPLLSRLLGQRDAERQDELPAPAAGMYFPETVRYDGR